VYRLLIIAQVAVFVLLPAAAPARIVAPEFIKMALSCLPVELGRSWL
jgi:hypothetical protein